MKLNHNFQNLEQSYLFVTIAQKVNAYTAAHPDNHLIRMGIGDVTLPLAPVVIEAMHKATDEMARKETFRGYSPDSNGYPFLREAIAGYYQGFGVDVQASEVFVGDGAKSDVGNIVDIFDSANTILVPDPVYPVYVDTNIMAGRKIVYADANKGNGFLPMPKEGHKVDVIYLCSPNNPTGAVYNKEQLTAWVDYALDQGAVIALWARACPGASLRFPGRRSAPLSSAPCPRQRASQECAAGIQSLSPSWRRTACRRRPCGSGGRGASSTG